MKTLAIGTTGLIGGIVLFLVIGVGFAFWKRAPSYSLLTDNLAEPLNDVTAAKIEINTGSGNLTVDRLTGGEPLLAGGTLEYDEKQGPPSRSLSSINGQAVFTLKGSENGRASFHFPWEACNGAFDWLIHLNPTVSSDITAYSGGGNVRLDLSGMLVTRLSADSGGGNLDVVLPEGAHDLDVTAKTGGGAVTVLIGSGTTGAGTLSASSGAGSVTVHVPDGIAARIHASTGMGKVVVDPRFSKIDDKTYQSPDYDSAANKVEITVHSGAGTVTVGTN